MPRRWRLEQGRGEKQYRDTMPCDGNPTVITHFISEIDLGRKNNETYFENRT